MMTKSYDVHALQLHKPLIVLTGPTAVGKTATSIGFAKAIGGEIISADSMQVYQGMDIGSAKIKQEEMEDVPHHLIDICCPSDEFNVLIFQQKAKDAISKIYENGHIPIITGGTGFYIQAVLYDIDFSAEADTSVRARLEREVIEKGEEILHQRLQKVDPDSAAVIHQNNRKRMIRALEFYELNGYPLSKHNETQRQKASPFLFRYYVLTEPREVLYERIERRVDQMLAEGLEREVKELSAKGYTRDMVSMQGLGYKEMLDYLSGDCSLDEAVRQIKQGTRHFAKRQLTWFRRERDVLWVDKTLYNSDAEKITAYLIKDFTQYVGNSLQNRS